VITFQRVVRRAFVAVFAILAAIGAARAHATLVLTHPADGAVLSQAPSTVRLKFNEPITPLAFRIVDPEGRWRDDAIARAVNDTIDVEFAHTLAPGTHVLSYRIVSADGHPVGGTLSFSVGAPSRAASVTGASGGRAFAIWLFRFALYLTLFYTVAATALASLAGGAVPRGRIIAGLAVTAIAAVGCAGLQGLDLLDAGVSALFESTVWRAALGSSYGATLLLCVLASALCGGALAGARRRIAFAACAALVAGAAFSLSGHASTAPPMALTRSAIFIHVVCVIALAAPLLRASIARAPGNFVVGPLGVRQWARPALALLVTSGATLAVAQLESPLALVETAYGRLLLVKLALIFATWALFVTQRRFLARGTVGARVAIMFQLALVVAVLGVTAGWRFTPPPRSLHNVGKSLHIHTEKMMAMVTFDPGRIGVNDARIELMTGDFAPLDAREIWLTIAPRSGAIEPVTQVGKRTPDGAWRVERLVAPTAGLHDVTVEALISDFDKLSISETFEFTR
jgi:copper transport protein